MKLKVNTIKGCALLAMSLVLVACGKQDQPDAKAFPTGNAGSVITAADCDKLEDPKPADESAAGRAKAVSAGQAARSACKKGAAQGTGADDLARIREIKEAELADQTSAKQAEGEFRKGIKEGGARPVRDFKY
ncbi:hypothetical protein EIP75_21575 [Aquabacterium soli]|uniref:Entry exclusion lipoprotein TrbK n=1 Tax=Aquabacterium soli TaxID=2493092 RepID=A0A426V2W6_9BURK|nr:hypothetical protein [Aquabacterium soli]RRS01168.1 hypothetical protein EIP75_21575 [Aquabacterium soli]